MNEQSSAKPAGRSGRFLLGAVMALFGSFVLSGLTFLSHSSRPSCEALMMSLGLAPAAAVSAAAQVALLVGIWLMWSAAHRS